MGYWLYMKKILVFASTTSSFSRHIALYINHLISDFLWKGLRICRSIYIIRIWTEIMIIQEKQFFLWYNIVIFTPNCTLKPVNFSLKLTKVFYFSANFYDSVFSPSVKLVKLRSALLLFLNPLISILIFPLLLWNIHFAYCNIPHTIINEN